MTEALLWWFIATLLGALAFPVVFLFLPALADRGYAFSRVLGILLVAYVFWLGGTIGVLPNNRASIIGLVVALAAAGALLAWRKRRELLAFLWEQRAYVLSVEALFVIAFAASLWLRSFVPEILAVEKLKDYSFINTLYLADGFPPLDPWLSGFDVNYYYFGYVPVVAVGKLMGTTAGIAYNLGLGLTVALSATAAFGLAYNLVARKGTPGQMSTGPGRTALAIGVIGLVLMLIIGNLEGLFELMAAHGVGSGRFYELAGLPALADARTTDAWYPTEHGWWFRAIGFFTWSEFPFFSFLLGDLHPHVLAIPPTLFAMGIALSLLRDDGDLLRRPWRHPFALVLTGLVFGSLGFIHSWNLPIALALLAAVGLLAAMRGAGPLTEKLGGLAFYLAVVAGLSLLMYLPFYLTTESTLELRRTVGPAVRPVHLSIMWGLFLVLAFALAVMAILRHPQRWRFRPWQIALAAALGVTPFVAWLASHLVLRYDNPPDLPYEAVGWWTVAITSGMLALLVLALARQLPLDESSEDAPALVFALAAAALAFAILAAADLFELRDPMGLRVNTILKNWYQAWFLLALSGAFTVYWTARSWRPRPALAWLAAHGWALPVLLLALAGLVYPVTATFARINESTAVRSLDGDRWMLRDQPQEYEALQWLRDNVEGQPVILEAACCNRDSFSRVSGRTGLVTVLGWPTHQFQVRGDWEAFANPENERLKDVERAYISPSIEDAEAVLRKYNVEYVYVGRTEREYYGEMVEDLSVLEKFGRFMDVVFRNPEVTIYRVRGLAAASAEP